MLGLWGGPGLGVVGWGGVVVWGKGDLSRVSELGRCEKLNPLLLSTISCNFEYIYNQCLQTRSVQN